MKYFKQLQNPFFLLILILGSIWIFLTRNWGLSASFFPVPLVGIVGLFCFAFTSFTFNVLRIRTFLEVTLVSLFLWSGLTFIIGRMGQLNTIFISSITVLILVPEILLKFQFSRYLIFSTINLFKEQAGIQYGLIFIVALFWGLTLVNGPHSNALLPDLNCDTSLVHLILPKHYLQNESIFNVWWTRGPFLPQFVQFLYLFPMKFSQALNLRYDIIPHIFATLFPLIILVIFFHATQSFVIALVAILLFISTPIISWSLGTAYLDLPATMMFLFSLYYFYKFATTNNTSFLKYLGLSLGLSFSTKPMLGMLLFPIGLIFFIHVWLEHRTKYTFLFLFRLLGLFTIFCLLPILIFYGYNWELTGNPIFPFLYQPVPNPYFWNKESIIELNGAISHWAGKADLLYFFKLFINIFSWNLNEHTDTIGKNLTPLLSFAIIGPILLLKFKKITLRAFLMYVTIVVVYYTTWYTSSAVMRYLIPLVGLFCISLSYALFKSRIILILFLILMSTNILKLISTYHFFRTNVPPPITVEQANNYLFDNSSVGKASKWLLANTAPTDLVYTYKVSCEWLRIPRPFLGDWFGHSNFGEFIKYSKENKFIEFINERNISFIFDSTAMALPSVPELAGSATACISEVTEASTDSVKLYKLNKELPSCLKTTPKPEIMQIIEKAPKTML